MDTSASVESFCYEDLKKLVNLLYVDIVPEMRNFHIRAEFGDLRWKRTLINACVHRMSEVSESELNLMFDKIGGKCGRSTAY